jgi:hypothetical protein
VTLKHFEALVHSNMLSCAGVLALSIVLFTPASSGLFHEECWSCELIEVAAGVR